MSADHHPRAALRAVFMGTPEFSIPSLAAVSETCDLLAVVTRPDRPRGRHRKVGPSSVKRWAGQHDATLLQPEDIRDPGFIEQLAALGPDVVVVVDFGSILPPQVLELPPGGCINAHASLLPAYRGAAPIERAIMAGETVTGVTTILMAEHTDTGAVLLQRNTTILPDETAGELKARLAPVAAGLLADTLELIRRGEARSRPQDNSMASPAPKLDTADARVQWDAPAGRIHDLIRAMNPRPGARTSVAGRAITLKLWRSRLPAPGEGPSSPSPRGTVVGTGDVITVATGDGLLEVTEVQPQNGKRMDAADYLRGHPLPGGTVLE